MHLHFLLLFFPSSPYSSRSPSLTPPSSARNRRRPLIHLRLLALCNRHNYLRRITLRLRALMPPRIINNNISSNSNSNRNNNRSFNRRNSNSILISHSSNNITDHSNNLNSNISNNSSNRNNNISSNNSISSNSRSSTCSAMSSLTLHLHPSPCHPRRLLSYAQSMTLFLVALCDLIVLKAPIAAPPSVVVQAQSPSKSAPAIDPLSAALAFPQNNSLSSINYGCVTIPFCSL